MLVSTVLVMSTVWCFGFLGHAIVARLVWKRVPKLKEVFDSYTDFLEHVHWPDQHKHEPAMAWAMPLHFYNNLADSPPEHCSNLDHAVREAEPNLIQACLNFTRALKSKASIGYAVHFLTDLHQPLHLTAKMRGGNDVRIEGKTLHLIWDTLLPKHLLRQFHGRFNRMILHLKSFDIDKSQASVLSWAGQVNRVNCLGGIWEHEECSLDSYLQLHRPTLIKLLQQAATRIALILH